jgi:ATP-binding cassette, subfamily B, bacterial PglK
MFSTVNDLLALLGRQWRKRFLWLLPLSIFRSLFDVVGVSLIAPLIAVTINPQKILENEIFLSYNFMEITTDIDLITYTAVAIILFYCIRAIFSLSVIHLNNIFFFNGRSYLSAKLLDSYLNSEWSFHLKTNSSILDARVRFEVTKVMSTMSNILKFLNELFFLVFSLSLLLYANFLATTIIFITFFSTFGIWIFCTRKKLKYLGDSVISSQVEIGKNLREAFDSLREINIYDASKYFYLRFLKSHLSNSHANIKQSLMISCPPLFVELVVMISISTACFLIIYFQLDVIDVAPTLALFGLLLVRMMPYASNISRTIQTIQFERPALDIIWGDLNLKSQNKLSTSKNFTFKTLKVKQINFSYDSRLIIQDLSFSINAGNFFGIFGNSGSGKTTLINLIAGLIKPSSGDILINDDPMNIQLQQWNDSISYLGQESLLIDASIAENIAFGASHNSIDQDKVYKSLKFANLHDFVDSLPGGIESSIGERGLSISGGQKQRLALARALYRQPKVLILDEFTSALDVENEKRILNTVSNLKDITIILISHSKTAKDFCSNSIELPSEHEKN